MDKMAWEKLLAYSGVANSVRILRRDYGEGAVLRFYAELASRIPEVLTRVEMHHVDWAAFGAVTEGYAAKERMVG